MFRNTMTTTALLAGLGGLMVAIGSLFGRAGAVVGLVLGLLTGREMSSVNLFRTQPTTAERVARLRGQR